MIFSFLPQYKKKLNSFFFISVVNGVNLFPPFFIFNLFLKINITYFIFVLLVLYYISYYYKKKFKSDH